MRKASALVRVQQLVGEEQQHDVQPVDAPGATRRSVRGLPRQSCMLTKTMLHAGIQTSIDGNMRRQTNFARVRRDNSAGGSLLRHCSARVTSLPVDKVAEEQVALLRRGPKACKDAQQHAVVAMDVAHDHRVRRDVQQRRLPEETSPASSAGTSVRQMAGDNWLTANSERAGTNAWQGGGLCASTGQLTCPSTEHRGYVACQTTLWNSFGGARAPKHVMRDSR